jgi:hypothetical protein
MTTFDDIPTTVVRSYCRLTIEEALQSGARYERLGIQVNYSNREGGVAVLSAKDQIDKNGIPYTEGELLPL